MRLIRCSMVMLVAMSSALTAFAENGGLSPQPQDAVVVPGCRMKDSFPAETRKSLEMAEKGGDLQRIVAAMRATRKLLDETIKDDAVASARLKPVFDFYFSDAMLVDRARCEFIGGMLPERAAAWEAWIENPAMQRIHSRITASPYRIATVPVDDETRKSLLVRIALAMRSDEILASRQRELEFLVAAVEDARDPSSSALAAFRDSRYWRGPGADAFAMGWLAPVLKDVSNADLESFLTFAESPAGKSCYLRFAIPHDYQLNRWHDDFAKAMAATMRQGGNSVAPAEADAMLEQARTLYRNGDARSYDQAKRLLQRAETIKPEDAQIQLYLGLTLMTIRETELEGIFRVREMTKPTEFVEAEAHLKKAVALDPSLALAYLAQGRARFLVNDLAEAERLYALAREHRCQCFRLDFYEGELFAARNDQDAAAAAFRRALDNPKSSGKTRRQSFEALKDIASQSKHAVNLRAVADSYLSRNPGDSTVREIYAHYLISEFKDYASALKVIDSANGDPGNDTVLLRALALSGLAQQGADRKGDLEGKYAIMMQQAISLVGSKELAMSHCASASDAATLRSVVRFSENPKQVATYVLGCLVLSKNNAGVVEMIAQGADVNVMAPDPLSDMPLCQAMLIRNAEAFKILLDAKADPRRKCSDGNDLREKMNWLRREDKNVETMMRMLDGSADTPAGS